MKSKLILIFSKIIILALTIVVGIVILAPRARSKYNYFSVCPIHKMFLMDLTDLTV